MLHVREEVEDVRLRLHVSDRGWRGGGSALGGWMGWSTGATLLVACKSI